MARGSANGDRRPQQGGGAAAPGTSLTAAAGATGGPAYILDRLLLPRVQALSVVS